MKLKSIVVGAALALGLAPGPSLAAPEAGPPTSLRVDDWRMSAAALDVLWRAALIQHPETTRQAVALAVAEDRVLARYAQQHVSPAQLRPGWRVGFAPEVNAQAALMATLERVFEADLRPAIGPEGPQRFVVRQYPVDTQSLAALWGDRTPPALDDRLSDEALERLTRVPVLDHRVDEQGPIRTVSLRDVWHQLDVHGRQAVKRGDARFVHHQALRIVRAAWVRHWLQSHQRLQPADFEALAQSMADRELRLALEQAWGASGQLHGAQEALTLLRAEATAADIRAYYLAHPEQFARTERVRAQHIRCGDTACAEAASAALQRGEAFATVAQRYSTASSAVQGGSLGWVEAGRSSGRWLAQLALAQAPGEPSRPIREPEVGGGPVRWQIVQVVDREQGVHPLDSETTRFIAAEGWARERAVERFTALKERLVREAAVQLSP
ncbi:peptidyl-prolyl cis-trans isomerase [Ideonella sp. DXS29W]|uniref:peptidylprolyl isomerase n=1 Tax=Ideonella lacteola TaxID=2984193 RepID=A0ABU9BYT5_9BURK